MKKILLIILLFIPSTIFAYENDYFNITIPDNYKEIASDEDSTYKWNSDNENELPSIIITVAKNTESNKQDVTNFTSESMEKYKNEIKSTIDKSLKEYNLEVQVSDLKIEKLNIYDSLTYTTIWPTNDTYGYDTYQKSYVITTNKYIVTLICSVSNEEDENSEEIMNIINTLTINDELIEKKGFFEKRTNQIIIVGVIAGIIGYILSVITDKKKAKK